MDIPKSGRFDAFSMIVDINRFTALVSEHDLPAGVANFVGDILAGSISAIEKSDGSVIGINGDAIFGVLPTPNAAAEACFLIAKDLDRMCEYLAGSEYEASIPCPPTLKIGVELGTLDASTIATRAMGTLPFCIGPATNYAARILGAGRGNRCHVGPKAFEAGLGEYMPNAKMRRVRGKAGEPFYGYYHLDMSDIWIEGDPDDGIYYWG